MTLNLFWQINFCINGKKKMKNISKPKFKVTVIIIF